MITASVLLQHAELQDFLSGLQNKLALSGREYSYLGVNFRAADILSIKLYYTFFGRASLGAEFPVAELAERFSQYADKLSEFHLDTPFVPGCGITFTIKFDVKQGISRGVYFRVKCDASEHIRKFLCRINLPVDTYAHHFDAGGVLKYLSIDAKGKVQERTYIYCPDCAFLKAFDQVSDIAFSQADCLEISTDWDDAEESENMKFIGISRKILAGEHSSRETAVVAAACRDAGLMACPWFALHGYYLHAGIKSAFFFGSGKGESSVLPPALRVGKGRA